VKGGGIDLLDLLKENLLAPTRLVSLRDIAGLATVAEQVGGLRVGPMVTLANLATHPVVRTRYPALADALQDSASPQIRNVATLGGNLLQRPRCWYFRAAEYHCLRKGGGHCFAISGENQYHAIFDNQSCAIVHPSTAATVLVALGTTIELANSEGATREALGDQRRFHKLGWQGRQGELLELRNVAA
jgi:xanthine dehydrogenase YagS FAD-binding subunit